LEGRDRATGFGVVATLKSWAKRRNKTLKGMRYIVQGFGNVGYWTAHFLLKEGATLIAVQDATATFHDEGHRPGSTCWHTATRTVATSRASAAQRKWTRRSSSHSIATSWCLLHWATRSPVRTPVASKAMVAEGANGPTNTEGERSCGKNIDIIPDILCNSGGVIGSYYEWLQNKRSEIWKIDEVLDDAPGEMDDAFHESGGYRCGIQSGLATSAYIVALRRLEKTYKERGIFP
jgi:glutamate dehydrogenase (NAD(P)+)